MYVTAASDHQLTAAAGSDQTVAVSSGAVSARWLWAPTPREGSSDWAQPKQPPISSYTYTTTEAYRYIGLAALFLELDTSEAFQKKRNHHHTGEDVVWKIFDSLKSIVSLLQLWGHENDCLAIEIIHYFNNNAHTVMNISFASMWVSESSLCILQSTHKMYR